MIAHIRMTAVLIAGAALVLSGCSTPAEEAHAPAKETHPPSAPGGSAAATADTAGEQDPSVSSAGDLDGSWDDLEIFTAPVVLDIRGTQVELRGVHRCHGSVSLPRKGKAREIRLRCDDGNTDRTVGRVWGLTDSAMTVDWEAFGADSFRRR